MEKIKDIVLTFALSLVFFATIFWGDWFLMIIGAVALTFAIDTIAKILYPENDLDDKIDL